MDRMELAKAAKSVLHEWKEFYKDAGGPEGQRGLVALAFDDERGHYLFLEWNWEAPRYTHSALIHLEVRDDCIWVHWDGTEQGVWDDLVRAGVPESCIVLGEQQVGEPRAADLAVA